MKPSEPAGFAFTADHGGIVREVLRDSVGLGARLAADTAVATLLESASRGKWRHFVAAVGREKAAFGWLMDLVGERGAASFEFAGVELEGGLVVVATPVSDADGLRLVDQLLAVSSDQATALRDALKRLALLRRAPPPATPTAALWAEQARINNELVNLQRELSRRNAELKRSNEQRNELLGIAAHDLRNPISSVRQFADVLLVSPLDASQRRSMVRIRDICDFMVSIVDDMLDLSALESGRLDLALQTVDLVAVVAENVDINSDLAAIKRIAIDYGPGDATLPTAIDTARFSQVLNNLLTNAVKFSHPGTTVSVTVRRDGDSAVVAVSDRGQGIASAEIGQLFKPFTRTSNRPTGGERSTGLGLAIVERIVRAHGGTIAVDSVVGVGSTFEVRLPLATAAGTGTGTTTATRHGPDPAG